MYSSSVMPPRPAINTTPVEPTGGASKVKGGYNTSPGFIMPSGKPSPYQAPAQAALANPWASFNEDPSVGVKNTALKGSLQQATQGLNYAAQKGWGKQLNQDQLNQLAGYVGYSGGAVDAATYNKALAYLPTMFGGPAGAEKPELTTPVNPMPNVGPGPASAEYQKQAQVVGVPQAYAQANPYQQQQQQLMQKILANPETMGQQQQDQLAEKQKEAGNAMLSQMQGQNQRQNVSRGFAAGGGREQAQQAQQQQDLISQLLSGRRDIALQAAQQNRGDQMNALNMSQQLGQQGWANDMQRAQMGLGQINQNRGLGLQEWLGEKGMDLDYLKFDASNQQFNKQFGLDFLQYMAQKDQFDRQLGQQGHQFNQQMGLNWNQNNFAQQQSFLNMLLSGF